MIDHDDVDDDHDDDKLSDIVGFYVCDRQMCFASKKSTPFEFAEAKAMAEKAQADAMAMVQSKCVLQ